MGLNRDRERLQLLQDLKDVYGKNGNKRNIPVSSDSSLPWENPDEVTNRFGTENLDRRNALGMLSSSEAVLISQVWNMEEEIDDSESHDVYDEEAAYTPTEAELQIAQEFVGWMANPSLDPQINDLFDSTTHIGLLNMKRFIAAITEIFNTYTSNIGFINANNVDESGNICYRGRLFPNDNYPPVRRLDNVLDHPRKGKKKKPSDSAS